MVLPCWMSQERPQRLVHLAGFPCAQTQISFWIGSKSLTFLLNVFSWLNISSYKALRSNIFFRRNLIISRPADSVSDLGDRREPRNQVKAA